MEYFQGNADSMPIKSDEDGTFAEAIRSFCAPTTLASPYRTASQSTSISLGAASAPNLEPKFPQIRLPLKSGIICQSNNVAKLPPIPASSFTTTTPALLPGLISDQLTLMIDIRPQSQYDAERISVSVPLSVPSTLLKRPLFTLEKLATMLPSETAIEQFNKWSVSERIILVDTESSKLTETGNVLGLLRKFRAGGFDGELRWVHGGFAAIIREAKFNRDLAKLLSSKPVSAAEDVRSGDLRNLTHAAFEQSSTTVAGHRPTLSPARDRQSTHTDNLTPRTHGAALGPSSRRVMAANPFYDNIRQLTELSQGITERIPLCIPQGLQDQSSRLPFKWLRDLAVQSESESAGSLAMQFYKIELTEQRRLMGIMDQHSRQSDDFPVGGDQQFPFSITAGIEEGEKNRYRNIWPYEHSRVQLRNAGRNSSDYINASYVQPPGTDKRYIATQGPLQESYADFWMMVWDQNVPAIVMLTKRFEGSSVKCGTYWPVTQHCGQRFGDIIVTLVSSPQATSEDDAAPPGTGGFNFGHVSPPEASSKLAKRTFTISNLRQPHVPPREIAHFQYLDWSDHDVPASPQGLLDLISDVERVTSDARPGPAVLHCSAGVGRTGAYILVDAVLDAVKRDLLLPAGEFTETTNSSQEFSLEMDTRSSADESPESGSPSGMARDVGQSASEPQLQFPGERLRDSHGPRIASTLGLPRSQDVLGGQLSPMEEVTRILATSDAQPKAVRHRATTTTREGSTASSSPMELETNLPPPRLCASRPAPIPLHQSAAAANSSDSSLSASSLSKQGSSKITAATSIAPSRKSSGSPPSPQTIDAFDFMQPSSTAVQSITKQTRLVSLSMIDEPIRHVLESMREQRMSLCQTLRQFVFAHRAIIEGSLALMDDIS